MTFAGGPLSQSLLGAKRTFDCAAKCLFFDPKRTLSRIYWTRVQLDFVDRNRDYVLWSFRAGRPYVLAQ
jgi:hypothetical protein